MSGYEIRKRQGKFFVYRKDARFNEEGGFALLGYRKFEKEAKQLVEKDKLIRG